MSENTSEKDFFGQAFLEKCDQLYQEKSMLEEKLSDKTDVEVLKKSSLPKISAKR